MPDGDDGGLKVETPDYIYKIVGQGEDDGDNKVWEPQRWWKDGSRYSPLTAHGGAVPLDVAKAVCAKDVIEEAAQEAEWEAAQETEGSETSDLASEPADGSETSEAESKLGARRHEEHEPDKEPLQQKIVTRDELMAVVAQVMTLPDMDWTSDTFDGNAFDVVIAGVADLELYDALAGAIDRLNGWRDEIGQHEIDGVSIFQLLGDRQKATVQAERDRLTAEEAERKAAEKAAAKAERKRERELEKLIRQQDKELGVDASDASSARSEAPKGKAIEPGQPLQWDDYAPDKNDGGYRRGVAETGKIDYRIGPAWEDGKPYSYLIERITYGRSGKPKKDFIGLGDHSYDDAKAKAQADFDAGGK